MFKPAPRSAAVVSEPRCWFLALLIWAFHVSSPAQSLTFAGNPQHTGRYDVPAQPLNQVHWSAKIDYNNGSSGSHYGAPLITAANTVLAPVRTNQGFSIDAFDGATGARKFSLSTDYVSPPYNWLPPYQPVIAPSAGGSRLWYPAAGGTVLYNDDPDNNSAGPPIQLCFFTDMANYESNAALYKATVYINTPLTADTNGAIYFGFIVNTNGLIPPFTSTNGGFAKIDANGNTIFVLSTAAANDAAMARVPHGSAPGLSNDGSTLYVLVRSLSSNNNGYLLGLNTADLSTRYRAHLPPTGVDGSALLDQGTASPTVAPDGDVFVGVFGHGNSRGWLLHYTADLSTNKVPGGFGWDHTAGIVPSSMVPAYTGASPYLLFTKYNNYAGGGNGINRVALLDPVLSQVDPFSTYMEKREVLTVIGCTPDAQGASLPYAVREWCINAAAINPSTRSIFFPSEDGRFYRWNLELNCLDQTVILDPGLGEPYVPAEVGPDGQLYTLNGGWLFAIGGYSNLSVSITSSAPDMRSLVSGQPVTFTATVTNLNAEDPLPTGTVTFRDVTYQGLTRVTNVLAAGLVLTNGLAEVTTSNLIAGGNCLGNHFLTASYSGDTHFRPGSATLVQKVHAQATVMDVVSAAATLQSSVAYTVQVCPAGTGTGIPTGMVSFWDGPGFLGQVPLRTNGTASFTAARIGVITNLFSASYASDTVFAECGAPLAPFSTQLTQPSILSNSTVQFEFSNILGAPFTVLSSMDPSLPLTNWTSLGPAVEISPGSFQFIDSAGVTNSQKFYRISSP